MSAATTAVMSNGTNSSAGGHWPATRVGGAAGWRCCSIAAARPDALPPNGSTAFPPNGSADGLVHALAGMALGALAGG